MAATTLAGCAAPAADDAADDPQQSTAPHLSLDECDAATPKGRVDRSARGLRFTRGVMQVKVEPSDGRAECVEFGKWGNASVEVPPDSLLFTFSGGSGEGGQFEFLASALTGRPVPGSRKPGTLTDPISAEVGVSVAGTYFTDSTCALTLTLVGTRRAAGRFDCTEAIEREANPFSPSDDVPHEEQPGRQAPPRTAALSGRFDVQA